MQNNHEVCFAAPGVVEVTSCEIAEPGDHQLLVRTRISLISPGTERAFLLGLPNTTRRYPSTSGYCSLGEVVAVGAGVTGWSPGDRVASGARHRRYSLLDPGACLPVPADLDDEHAPFFQLAAIALQGVRKARIELGEPVAVLGAGLIGLLALQLARLSGALPALAVDLQEERLAFARAVGADGALAGDEGLKEALEKRCGGQGPAVVIEATGHPAAAPQAFDLARHHGRVVLLGSTRGETEAVNFYRDVHKKGLTLIGAHASVVPAQDSSPGYWTLVDDQRVALRLLAGRRLAVAPLITHRFGWQEAPAAYEVLKSWDPGVQGILLDWREDVQ